jgi:hypothetical protein
VPLNKFRYVDYADDGCNTYQCLNCRKTWTVRYPGPGDSMPFCGFCGTRWEGQHEWPHDERDWVRLPEGQFTPTLWLIEERFAFGFDPVSAWSIKDYVKGDVWDVQRELKWRRGQYASDDICRVEFRARPVKSPADPNEIVRAGGQSRRVHCSHQFWVEYQKRWGGSLHYPPRERSWILRRKSGVPVS